MKPRLMFVNVNRLNKLSHSVPFLTNQMYTAIILVINQVE